MYGLKLFDEVPFSLVTEIAVHKCTAEPQHDSYESKDSRNRKYVVNNRQLEKNR